MGGVKLTARQEKVLRYLASKGGTVKPSQCVVRISGCESDLPRTALTARAALEVLRSLKLVRRDESGYAATTAGKRLIKGIDQKQRRMI